MGNTNGEIAINVSDDTQFSSIKKIKEEFTNKQNAARIVKSEMVPIRSLDALIGQHFNENEVLFLKIDTQGYEKEVIEGAAKLITMVKGMKMEIPLVNELEIYEDVSWDLNFYIKFFDERGFKCMSLESIGADRQTGIVNEVDGVFFKI